MRVIGKVGQMVWAQWDEVRHAAAVIGTVLYVGVQPRYWVRTVRQAFVWQILAIGVESVGFVGGVAVFVGIAVVVQLEFWVRQVGQSQLLGPLLVAVVARELSPVLISLVVIVRSGSVMATELGIMKIDGRVHVLEAQGISPFVYLVMPHCWPPGSDSSETSSCGRGIRPRPLRRSIVRRPCSKRRNIIATWRSRCGVPVRRIGRQAIRPAQRIGCSAPSAAWPPQGRKRNEPGRRLLSALRTIARPVTKC